jgi:hypothetical protein
MSPNAATPLALVKPGKPTRPRECLRLLGIPVDVAQVVAGKDVTDYFAAQAAA